MRKGFTLSEVLITLVIIGIVAAVTVPVLFNNTEDKEYNVARQKAKATIGEAFKLMTINGEIDKNKSTAEFATEILPKYLKVAKMCGSSDTAKNLTDCGFSPKVKRFDGTQINFTEIGKTWQSLGEPRVWNGTPTTANTWVEPIIYNSANPDNNTGYALQTVDGYSIDLFYNPHCVANGNEKVPYFSPQDNVQMSMDVVCFNAIYDMNGSKGPNQVGKDIGFVGSFYNSYSVNAEAVLPYGKIAATSSAPGTSGTDYVLRAQQYCKNLSNDDSLSLPNVDELSLLHINLKMLYEEEIGHWFWSRSSLSSDPRAFMRVSFSAADKGGYRAWYARNTNGGWALCVRNTALK